MAFDGAANVLVDLVAPVYLYAANGSPAYEDWEFTGGLWSNQTAHLPATPPIGYDPLSEWDAADGYLFYLAGGYNAQSWALGATPLQTQVSASPSPVDVGNVTTISALVSGGAPPLRYTYSGLPPGCVGSSVPILACAPTSPGNFSIRLSVEDALNVTVNASTSLEVGAALTAAGPLSPATAYLGASASFSVEVAGGIPPYRFDWQVPAADRTPPNSASFDCTLTQIGSLPISVSVTDATPGGEVTAVTELTVVNLPTVVSFTTSLPIVEVGGTFTLNATIAGGAVPLSYNYSGLPAGCAAISNPTLTCGPTQTGSFNVTVSVTDGLGSLVRATVRVTVLAALVVSSEQVLPNPAAVGTTVSFGYSVAGGEAPFHSQWADLPPGCQPSQATFECVMNASGSYDVGITVRDALGGLAHSNLSFVVEVPGGASGTGSGLGSVALGTWAALGLGAVALMGLFVWDRRRRRRSPEPTPAPSGSGRVRSPGEEGLDPAVADPYPLDPDPGRDS